MPNVAVVQWQVRMICYNQRAPLAHPSPKSLYDFNHWIWIFLVVKHIRYKITYSTGILGDGYIQLLLFISTVLKTALESVTPSPGFITLPLAPWAPPAPDPAQAQVQGTSGKLGFFKEREFSSLISLFPAKDRPVFGMLVPEKKAPCLCSHTTSPVRLSSAESSA